MPLSYQTLLSLAGPGPYRRGAEYCRQGRVTLTARKGGEVFATVQGREGHVYTVVFVPNRLGNELEDYYCDCPAYANAGFCKHLVAAILEAQAAEPFQAGGGKSRLISSAVTSMDAKSLLERSARRIADRAATAREGEAVLQAILELTSFGIALSLRVGTDRMYVVRDLSKFYECFQTGATSEYGRQLTLWHHPAAFGLESRALAAFFLRCYGNSRPALGYHSPAAGNRSMELTRVLLDELLALHIGQDLIVRLEGEERTIRVLEQDYRPALVLREEEGVCRLAAAEKFRLLRGAEGFSVLAGNEIYRCGAAWSAACGDLLDTLQKSGGALLFARRDLTALHATVLAEAEGYLSIDMDEEIAAWRPEPLETRIYLDSPGQDTVTARMTFTYGDHTHAAYQEKTLQNSLDLAGELLAQDILSRYFPGEPGPDGVLTLRDDPDGLYRLASRGIEELGGIAALYISDEVGKLKVQSSASVRIGVRVGGGGLLLDFDLDGVDFRELAGVLESYREKKKYHRLRDGSFLALEGGPLSQLAELAEGLSLDDEALESGHAALALNRSLYLDAALKESHGLRYDRDSGFRSIVRSMRDVADADFPIPEALSDVLRNYQKTGYRWLRALRHHGFGGILADDMGLGKTIQVLTLLEDYRTEAPEHQNEMAEPLGPASRRLPSIVVCPASLTLNWESEARRFAPGLRAKALLGTAQERESILREIGEYDLLITSYDQLKRDIDSYRDIAFAFVVADEAQYIKNQDTQNARAVKLLSGETRLALTGTPVENSLAELWSIFDFLMPGYLLPYLIFRGRYELPIVKHGDYQATERLRQLAKPFLLRRLKQEVLEELPSKTETVLKAEMEPEQRKLYLATLAKARRELTDVSGGQGRMMILAALTRMRQICCDPALLFEDYAAGSVKSDACLELVEQCIASGHRVLLFSQFTTMLDLLEKRLNEKGIDSFKLVGATKPQRRHELVTEFNAGDTPVFLISLKAGGTGLNLTGADVVIHYDPWWNASAQNQATDRAHRIGQKRSVQVYKLIVRDTVEERILRMQEEKSALAERILQDGGDAFEALSKEELLGLLGE